MIQTQRQLLILEKLKDNPALTTKSLALELAVSEMTIRRDFNDLANQGLIVREHGGAIAPQVINQFTDQMMESKLGVNVANKVAIAKKAVEFINDGDCVFLDGGTTSLALLPYLIDKKITIVTHSDLTLRDIKKISGEIILLGGSYNLATDCTYGPICLDTLRKFSFDICFVSCIAVSNENGDAYTADTNNAQIKEFAMAQSSIKVLLADFSKFGQKGFYKFAELADFDYLITDYKGVSNFSERTAVFTVESK